MHMRIAFHRTCRCTATGSVVEVVVQLQKVVLLTVALASGVWQIESQLNSNSSVILLVVSKLPSGDLMVMTGESELGKSVPPCGRFVGVTACCSSPPSSRWVASCAVNCDF